MKRKSASQRNGIQNLIAYDGNLKKVFSVKNLYESLWEESFLYSSGNTVMVHIRRLRMKIEDDPQKPKMIQTVWGKGYRLDKSREIV